jgi:DNA-binding MarR family transcriptional regulator
MTDEATTSDVEELNDKGETTNFINVGEHSGYKSVEDLIKGKAEADKFIERLKAEAREREELIAQLQKNNSIVEELKQIRSMNMNTENTNAHDVNEDAMKQIALKVLQDENANKIATDNLNNCKSAVAALNSDVELAMKNKAQELGCTVEYLEGIAKTSPKAFKSMFGIKETVSFDSVNFLQSSRHVTQTDDAKEEINAAMKNAKDPRQMADLFNKLAKDPSLLNNINTW